MKDKPKSHIKGLLKQILPLELRDWLRIQRRRFSHWPPVGWTRFGSFRRLSPISRDFGLARGLPVDRYYIEKFLKKHSSDIRGRVLEIGDSAYTRKFGKDNVVSSEVLHIKAGNPQATIVGNLATGEGIPSSNFDCVILTQTLHCIYELKSAILNSYSALKPGGVLLMTIQGISQTVRYDMDRWGDYWRFTVLSARLLLEEAFSPENIVVESYGNVLAAVAFLHGLAVEDLKERDLDYQDQDYDISITARAVK